MQNPDFENNLNDKLPRLKIYNDADDDDFGEREEPEVSDYESIY